MKFNNVLKKAALGTVLLSSSLLFSNEVAFTQGNPPTQNQVKRDHHVIFTGDVIWGKVEFVPTFGFEAVGLGGDGKTGITEMWALFQSNSLGVGVETVYDARLVKNRAKLGFMAGIGVALNRTFNLMFHFKYLRSGRTGHAQFDWLQTSRNLQLGAQGTPNSLNTTSIFNSPIAVDASNHFRNRVYILDLLIQTSHWMTSKLRFQPFGGIRYLYRKTNSNTKAGFTETVENDQGTFFSHEKYTQSSFAVIFGTDVKYLIWKNFFFFSTFLSQIAGDFSRKTNVNIDNSIDTAVTSDDTQGIFNHAFRDSNLNVNHSWEQKFGFAWEHAYGDDWLLSLRLFVELQENLFKDYGFGFTVLF